MDKLEFVKTGLEIVASIGVSMIAGNAVTLVTPETTKLISKLCIRVGRLALIGIATDKASEYVSDTIDGSVEKVKGWFNKETPKQETEEIETT